MEMSIYSAKEGIYSDRKLIESDRKSIQALCPERPQFTVTVTLAVLRVVLLRRFLPVDFARGAGVGSREICRQIRIARLMRSTAPSASGLRRSDCRDRCRGRRNTPSSPSQRRYERPRRFFQQMCVVKSEYFSP